jgi:hypothetical protein
LDDFEELGVISEEGELRVTLKIVRHVVGVDKK